MVGLLETGQSFDAQSLLEDAAAFDPGAFGAFGIGVASGTRESFGAGTMLREREVRQGARFARSRGLESKPLSEADYKSSPFFRPNIPWDEGMTTDRAAALADLDDRRAVREQLTRNHPVASFLGNLAGQAFDPINYIPFFGPASKGVSMARGGIVASKQGAAVGGGIGSVAAVNRLVGGPIRGRAAVGSIDAAGNTLVAGLATASFREGLGDDTSFGNLMFEVGTAALIGAAFGGAVGVRDRIKIKREMAVLRNAEANHAALNDGISTFLEDGSVKISEPVADRVADIGRAEQRSFEDVVNELRTEAAAPKPEGRRPESLSDFIAARGGIATKRGELVEHVVARKKLIRKNGMTLDQAREAAAEAGFFKQFEDPDQAIANASDADLINLLRDDLDGDRVVRRGDEAIDAAFRDFREQPNLDEFDRALDDLNATMTDDLPVEMKQRALELMLSERIDADNALEWAISEDDGPKIDTTPATEPAPNPRVAEAEASIGKPVRDIAEEFGIDEATGHFDELDDIAVLDAQGRMTPEDFKKMAEAEDIMQRTESYNKALDIARMCET